MAQRILHVVESLAPEAGSVAICLRGLLDALASRDVSSETLTTRDAASNPDVLGQRVTAADAVHIHGWGYRTAGLAAKAAKQAGRPYILSPLGGLCDGVGHDKGWLTRVRESLIEGGLVRGAVAVTSLNEAEDAALAKRLAGKRPLRLTYGLDTGAYDAPIAEEDSLPPLPEGKILLILGPLHPVEGFVPLLKAFAEIGSIADGWSVVLAGRDDGGWRKMLEAAIRRKGGDDRVVFLPADDVTTQRALLRRASLLALPSLRVRPPVSMLQAMAAGVPVLATSCAAPPDMSDAFRLCGPRQHEIKVALRKMLDLSDEERRAMGRRGREMVRARYDWSTCVDEFLALYERTAVAHAT